VIYLLHFSRRYKHAGHYLGFAKNFKSLVKRLKEHRRGSGANLVNVVQTAGIDWQLVRIWYGPGSTRTEERRIKKMGGLSRSCPLCSAHSKSVNNKKLPFREEEDAPY
jgi:hypothetical protein